MLDREKILNTYQWKVTKRILKKEFPWIIDIDFVDEHLYENVLFVIAIINPYIFSETTNYKMYDIFASRLKYGEEIGTISFLSTIFNIPTQKSNEYNEKIQNTLLYVENTVAIPEELKLPKKIRRLLFSEFEIPANIKKPN